MGALRRMSQKNQPRTKNSRGRPGSGLAGVDGVCGPADLHVATPVPSKAKPGGGGGGDCKAGAGAHGGGQNQAPAPSLTPPHDEIFAAVESLYADELKPFGRILRKRIAERAVGTTSSHCPETALPDVDIKHLRHVCHTSDHLHIVPEEGGDWSAMLVGREPRFVNVYSPVDLYPAKLWEQATTYFESLTGDEMCLPGGRYSCAQALVARNLPFLAGRSLGQVCHIVQLAISQKRILGYYSGAVVPYSRSQSMVKEWCAFKGTPCTNQQSVAAGGGSSGNGVPPIPLATWDQARSNLRQILQGAATSSSTGMVPLSNVKRLFRSRFQVELSETRLGYSKLSELLQDQRFHDICKVQLQGHGYIVIENKAAATTPNAMSLTLAGVLPKQGAAEVSELKNKEPARVELDRNSPLRRAMRSDSPPGFGEGIDARRPSFNEVFEASSPTPTAAVPVWPATPDISPVRTRYVWGKQNNGGNAGLAVGMMGIFGGQSKELGASLMDAFGQPTGAADAVAQGEISAGTTQRLSPFEATCRALNPSLRATGMMAYEDGEAAERHSGKRDSEQGECTTNDGDSRSESVSPTRSGLTEAARTDSQSASPPSPAMRGGNPMKIFLGRSHEESGCSNAGDESPFGGCSSDNASFLRTPSPTRNRYFMTAQQRLDLEAVEIFGDGASALPPPPLPMRNVGLSPVAAAVAAATAGGGPRCAALSPSRLSKKGPIGSMVQRTFIHAQGQQESPETLQAEGGPIGRSHSVPRTFGSNKDCFETACHTLAYMPRTGDENNGTRFQNSAVPRANDATSLINFGQTPSPLLPTPEGSTLNVEAFPIANKGRCSPLVSSHQVLHLAELI